MNDLAQMSGGYGQYLSWIVGFLFVLTVVVFFHELGHFLVARWCGVKVKAFAIGFGKEIWGFNDRYGTRWCLNWIPMGGYVKFIDDESAASTPDREKFNSMSEEDRAGTFQGKAIWQRAAIVAAGPIANFLLAIAIFGAFFALHDVPYIAARVGEITVGSAAEAAGMQKGDLVLSIDGVAIETFEDMKTIVSTNAGRALKMRVERKGQEVELTATPRLDEKKGPYNSTIREGLLGVRADAKPEDVRYKHFTPLAAIAEGVKRTKFIVDMTLSYLGKVFSGREKADQIGGPLMIAQVSGEAVKSGLIELLNVAGVISVSIGLMNLFPIPMLDGGHLLFYAIEAIRRRPLSERTQEIGFRIGLAAVLMLFVFATRNDLVRLFG